MADEQPNEETETETPIVEVTVNEESETEEEDPTPEVVEAPEQTVIVEADDSGVSDSEADRWIELERWKTEMERTVLDLVQSTTAAQVAAEEAVAEAEVAAETVDEFAEAEAAAESAPEETPEDEAPASARTHWLFESRADRRSRKQN